MSFTTLFSIALLNLLAAMTPGPDFAVVTYNTLRYSRQTGIFTALGIACAIVIHISYCILGLALIITHTPWLFTLIKWVGGTYLIYLGINALRHSKKETSPLNQVDATQKAAISHQKAFGQGFLTNLLNPKAAMFFLALFTMVVEARVEWMDLLLVLVLFCTVFGWFAFLSIMLSHRKIAAFLASTQHYLICATGICLIAFGILLFFAH